MSLAFVAMYNFEANDSNDLINPFLPNDFIWCRETFRFIISLPATSLELGFCVSRKDWQGEGAPKGCKQHGHVGARLKNGLALVGTGRTISVLFWHKWTWKQAVLPCRASISSVYGLFFSYTRLAFPESMDWKFINWWVWLESHICLRWPKLALGDVWSPTSQGNRIRIHFMAPEAERDLWKCCGWERVNRPAY